MSPRTQDIVVAAAVLVAFLAVLIGLRGCNVSQITDTQHADQQYETQPSMTTTPTESPTRPETPYPEETTAGELPKTGGRL